MASADVVAPATDAAPLRPDPRLNPALAAFRDVCDASGTGAPGAAASDGVGTLVVLLSQLDAPQRELLAAVSATLPADDKAMSRALSGVAQAHIMEPGVGAFMREALMQLRLAR